jgi:hypothetical protein
MEKKKVFIYGTCQSSAVMRFLRESKEFNEKYEVIEQVLSYEKISQNIDFIEVPSHFWNLSHADVFFYQPVRDIYGKNATNYLKSFLQQSCVPISMPFIYNSCTYPLVPALKRDFTDEWLKGQGDKLVLINREAIDVLIDKGLSSAEILSLYDNNELDFYFQQRISVARVITAEKEADLDIKVGDYIFENITGKRLFLYCSHPTTHVLLHAANQVLGKLGCDPIEDTFDLDFCGLSSCGMPVPYPTASVSYFNFEFQSGKPPDGTDQFYRNLIIGHLHSKHIK